VASSLDSGEARNTEQRGGGQRFRGGLVFKAHRLSYHSTLGLRVIKKKKKRRAGERLIYFRREGQARGSYI